MTEENIDGILPSKKAAIAEQEKIARDKKAVQRKDLMREDFGKTFQTEHGKRVLAYIMQRSGFGRVILSADRQGTVDPMATTFAAMELNFYLDIRQHISTDVLHQVEYGLIKPSGSIETPDAPKRKTSKSKGK